MSYAQWWHEFVSLREKEKKESEAQHKLVEDVYRAAAKTFRDTLIYILGTNIGAGKPKEDGDPTPYIPLVTYIAKPELMEELLNREREEKHAASELENKELDKLNDMFAEMNFGDLEPLFSGKNSDDPEERMKDPEYQQMLREMGLELYDSSKGETPEDAR